MATRGFRRIWTGSVLASALLLQVGCGASVVSSSTLPTTPAPVGPFANVAGTWTGTLESANFAPRTITLTVVQGGNCVDGAWLASSSDWSGAISGFADATSFSGEFSFQRAESGGRCGAIATVSGEVGSDTLRWTGGNFAPVGTCSEPLPQSVVITLRRQ